MKTQLIEDTSTVTFYSLIIILRPNGYFNGFCSQKSSQGGNSGSNASNTGTIDSTMVYEGALDQSSASPSTYTYVLGSHGNGIAGIVSITFAVWRAWQLF